MRERVIEQRLVSKAKHAGGQACKFISPGARGVPDRLVLGSGARVAFVELKAPGEVPTPLQTKRRRQLEGLGFRVFTCDSPESVDTFVEDFFK